MFRVWLRLLILLCITAGLFACSEDSSKSTDETVVDPVQTDTTAPVITLKGTAVVTVEQGLPYVDAGATAKDAVDGDVLVSSSGTVNTQALGSYTLTYTAADKAGNKAKAVRTVNVVAKPVTDKTPPVITLLGADSVTVYQRSTYQDAGATARDETDGVVAVTLTGTVDTASLGTYTLTYNAVDKAGNKASVIRTVVVVVDTTVPDTPEPMPTVDITAPVITLLGSNPVTATQWELYVDAGATAVDDVDGPVTVISAGEVDTKVLGAYTITYTALDKSGNSATTTRTVQVIYSTPSNFKVNPTEQLFRLSWDEVAGAEFYSVCYATAEIVDFDNCLSLPNGAYVGPITDTQVDIKPSPVQPGVAYYFQISAGNASGMSSAPSASVSARLLAPPQATGKLNDTGITTCANESENGLPCPVEGFPNQDAEQGRDVTQNDNSDGHAGFSFTKIGSKGEALPASATEWSCVKDNVTGLVWEVKTDDGGLHDKDWTYSWYEPDGTRNGGDAGYQNEGQCGETSSCDTLGFVQKVNETGWCGAKNWRLPTMDELFGIVRWDRFQSTATDTPPIDTDYFPNTTSSVAKYGEWVIYWSSSSVAFYSSAAWTVYFFSGNSVWVSKDYAFQVRLVRSGQ